MLHKIRHHAIIRKLHDNVTAEVSLTDSAEADCTGCHIASLCRRDSHATITVVVSGAISPRIGDHVEIAAPAAMSRRAVAILLLMPLATLIIALTIATAMGCSEAMAVTIGLLSLTIAFATLYACRKYIESPNQWTVIRILDK